MLNYNSYCRYFIVLIDILSETAKTAECLSENLKQKMIVLRETIVDLECKLSNRPMMNRQDSLPHILYVCKLTSYDMIYVYDICYMTCDI